MRFMFIAHPQTPPPLEQFPALMDGFAAWWERYRDRFESAGFFAGGNGGGGICDVTDAAEFHRMVVEWPLTPFSTTEGYPLVDMDTALSQWRDLLASMQGGGPG
jgi:hypothetical protein